MKTMMSRGCFAVISFYVGLAGLVGHVAAETVVGSGQVYTATKTVKLSGAFSGIVIGADGIHVNAEDAIVDCGSVASSIGVRLNAHSRVHVSGGIVQNCTIGVLMGNPLVGGAAGSKNHVNGMTIRDLVFAGSTHFNGVGVATNNGSDNRVNGNTFRNLCAGIVIFSGSGSDAVANDVQTSRSDCPGQGVVIQDSNDNSVHDNSVTTVHGQGIVIATPPGPSLSTGNFITGNTATGNLLDLWDITSDCTLNTWRGNVFVTDGGAESDGPGVGCIQ